MHSSSAAVASGDWRDCMIILRWLCVCVVAQQEGPLVFVFLCDDRHAVECLHVSVECHAAKRDQFGSPTNRKEFVRSEGAIGQHV